MRTVFITGYPFSRPAYRDVFNYLKADDFALKMIVPRRWSLKKGVVRLETPSGEGILSTPAFFFHSHYPVIGGLFKGFMPWMPFILFRRAHHGDLLYTALEPSLLSALYNGIWAKILGLKHILFTWENIPYEKKYSGPALTFKRLIIMLNRFFCDGLICGNPEAGRIAGQLGFRTSVIPLSGVDTERFAPGARADTYRGVDLRGRTVIVFAGAFDDRKGLPDLLAATELLIAGGSSVALFLVGTGELHYELECRIASSSLKEAAFIVPWLSPEELADLFRVADIFAYPSTTRRGWAEQFGYSVAEAMATGRPAVVSSSGALPWVVKDGETGLCVAEHDQTALARALESLIKDPVLRRRMGDKARADILERFSYAAIASAYAAFFRKHL